MTKPEVSAPELEQVAGNGLLHRRLFLTGGAAMFSAGSLGLMSARPAGAQGIDPWLQRPGGALSGYGNRSPFEDGVVRTVLPARGTDGSGAARTPLESLEGIITPNGLFFERHHAGIPAIDPNRHRLLIHGLVERPLVFDMESLYRYPMESRIQFLECSGNSRPNLAAEPPQESCGFLHGTVSCAEWTGIPLSILLDEAGVTPAAGWVLAEGADAAAMTRSVPLEKAMDDALIALYQNGERIRPSQGYPMRLFLPGWEGNASIKWLRRLKLTPGPQMTREETSKYTDLQRDGRSLQFTFEMAAKSVITSPSFGMTLAGPGLYQISGIAWSSAGRIRAVEVSADGGQTWAEAALGDPVLPKCLTRFRMAWRYDGGTATLVSRAIDETGAVQPLRSDFIAANGPQVSYHNNSTQSWRVDERGAVSNVYV
ncbi:MAG TPA: sulfite dehydrogenase [Gammaproteobacteria bacterium]